MRRAVWAPLLALAAVPLALPAAAARSCDGVVNVSRTPGRGEGEESLSVNPRNPKQPLLGSNQFEPTVPMSPVSAGGLMEAASWVSQDGGCTWRALGLGRPGSWAASAYPDTVPELDRPWLAVDPRGTVFMTVATGPFALGLPAEVYLVSNRDHGRTWGPRVLVSRTGKDQQDHVTLAYTPAGELVVVWRDRAATGGTWQSPFQVWARLLGHRAVQVSTGPQQPTTLQRGGPTMPSEFLGVATTPTHLLVAWDQLVGSLPDNVFRAIPLVWLQ